MRRTIYVVLADKRTGRRLGVKRLKNLARDVAADIPRGYLDRYRGDYIAGGTRFGVTPDDDSMTPVPCMKIRADDDIREVDRPIEVSRIGHHRRGEKL